VTTLFISDLHLDTAHPDITEQFLKFLRDEAVQADALYILGDLFELWIGDDDPDPEKQRIVGALRQLSNRGVRCFLIHGNRDFLLGKHFAAASGCTLLADGTIVTLYGRKVLLMHGDVLCTDDRSYQRLRRIVRNPLVQWIFRHLSFARRQALARKIRAGSKEHIGHTAAYIMDVNANAVTQTLRHYRVDTLVHGHTHRPAVHQLQLDGKPATRIVLGDWYEQGSVLRWSASGYELESLPREKK
jgi:UDP-2,3-diacylglucosamine hydrolase